MISAMPQDEGDASWAKTRPHGKDLMVKTTPPNYRNYNRLTWVEILPPIKHTADYSHYTRAYQLTFLFSLHYLSLTEIKSLKENTVHTNQGCFKDFLVGVS